MVRPFLAGEGLVFISKIALFFLNPLRQFCEGIGLNSIKFHTLRACFATQLLRDSVVLIVVMKICGLKDLKTMQKYIRLAGIEIEGATENLKILLPKDVMGRIVQLFQI